MHGLLGPCPRALGGQALPSFVEEIFLPCVRVFSTYPIHPKKTTPSTTKPTSHASLFKPTNRKHKRQYSSKSYEDKATVGTIVL